MNNPLSVYRHLPRAIYVLSFATLVNSVANFVYPFLVLYLTTRLSYSAAQAGRFMTLTALLYVPFSLLGSVIADHFGRKRLMITTQLCMAVVCFLCGWIDGSPAIPVLILIALGIDGMCDPAWTALKTDVTTPENRQASFSLVYLSMNLGYTVGPMIGGLLFSSHIRWLFWGNAIALAASTIPVALLVPESNPTAEEIRKSRQGNAADRAEEGSLFHALRTRPLLLLFAVGMTFFSFGYSQMSFALPLFFTDLFGSQGALQYGRIMAFNSVIVVVGNPLVISQAKRLPPLRNLAGAAVLFMLGFLPFIWTRRLWVLYLAALVFTVGEILWVNNERTFVANHTPISHRARFGAILPIIEGTGQALAPFAGGAIIDRLSMDWLWITSIISFFIGAMIILALSQKKWRESQ